MEIIVQDDSQGVGQQAAHAVAELLRCNPTAVLGLATGSTMIPFYRELVRLHREECLDFSRAVTFNLDEYLGLPRDHPCSYHHFMWEHFFGHVNIRPRSVHIPDGRADDLDRACADYEEEIRRQGGIDLQLLGIGCNGHIGFNEPHSPFDSRTRVQALTPQTVQVNQRQCGNGQKIPRQVLTMGIGTILEAGCCLLLACGESKARVVADAVDGPQTTALPASALQMHPDTSFILDQAAASRLTRFRAKTQRRQERKEEEKERDLSVTN